MRLIFRAKELANVAYQYLKGIVCAVLRIRTKVNCEKC